MSSFDYTLESLFRDLPAYALGEALAFHRREVERLALRHKRTAETSLYDRHATDALRVYHATMCEAILESGARRDAYASAYERNRTGAEPEL